MNKNFYWLVPEMMHSPIKQDVVLLRCAAKSAGAKAFLDFIHTEQAQNIIAEYGYRSSISLNKGEEI